MHRHVLTVDVNTSVKKCAQKIIKKRVGCLIVSKHSKPVGIITERDFVILVNKSDYDSNKLTAQDIMSSNLISIEPDATFSEAMKQFNKKRFKRMPVILNNKLKGLLTLKNMIIFSNISLAKKALEHDVLKIKASIDELTNVSNKGTITNAIKDEYESIQRYGGRTSILFIDIDHFKKVNDSYSHLAGDAVLRDLGKLLKKVCRKIDSIGRFGGEEFVIIAPNRKKYHAIQFAERLRRTIESHKFFYEEEKIAITVSIGIASLFQGRDYNYALGRADKALYHAKNHGRNRIGLWRNGRLSIAEEHSEE